MTGTAFAILAMFSGGEGKFENIKHSMACEDSVRVQYSVNKVSTGLGLGL